MYYQRLFCFTSSLRLGQVAYQGGLKTVALVLGCLAVLSGPVSVAQTTYYVAAGGNDANDGRSVDTPFQTLTKVNGLSLQAGDQVLFRRGDTFRGTLTIRRSGLAGQPIVFDAYGEGAKPTLSGSVPVTGWTSLGGNVWQATCTNCGSQVTGLHRNTAALPLGRYPNFDAPNKGYLTVQSHTGNGQIVSRQPIPLNLNTGWQGGEVAVRSMQWIIDRAGISSQSGNALNLMSQTLTYPINDNWGFFIQNHPATLDQAGEWCYDNTTKQVRLYQPAADPNTQTLTATAYRSAVDIASVSFITLRNLHLTETLNYGLWVNSASNLTLTSLDVTHSGEDGVQMIGAGSNVLMEDCRIVDVNNNGVRTDAYKNVTLRNNLVRRVGTQPGRGKGGDGQYNGVALAADENVLIEGNRVDSIGYNGISFWNNTLVQRNVVTNYCMTKSDGGGLYVWNGTRRAMGNIRVRSNIIYNGFGAPEGTPNGAYSGVNGFFLDDCVHNVELTGNTTYNNHGLGFFLHAVSGITMRNNTSFGNGEGQLAMTHNHGVCPARSNVVANNVFVSRLFGEFNVKYESDQNDLPSYGQIDSNYYVRPFEKEFVIRAVWNYGPGIRGADFNIEEWRSRFGKDSRTVASPVVHKDYQVTQVIGQPRFTQPFDTNLSNWSVMLNQPGAGRADWVNGGGLDGGSLRVSFPQPSGETWFFNSRVMVATGAGVIQAGKTYRLSFDAVATSNTKRIQAFLQTPGTPSYYFDSRTMLMAGTTRKRHEVVFTPTTNLTNAQVGFQIFEDGQTIWLDNVQFEEVTTTPVNPDDRMRLLCNPTTRDSVITLGGSYRDEKGQVRSGQVTLAPFTSLVLLTDDGSTPPPPPPIVLRDPENPAEVVAGLDYRYYEGTWTALPDFTTLTPVKTGTIGVPDLSVRDRDNGYGLRFTGYVNVPADGQYTFYTSSDDGSKLFIGTTEVVSNDAVGSATEKSGTIGLKAGKHAITVVYFQNTEAQSLSVSYEGPGLGKQTIPAGAFYRAFTTPPPPPPPIVLRDPENPTGVVVGLDYKYYEGTWTALPDFNALTPVKTGMTGVPDITLRNRDSFYGLRFTGYVDVPADGQYTFYTNSDDGSKLFIGTTEVVSNDAVQAATEKSGTIGLKAGKHAITVVYFQNGGGQSLSVSYSSPNLSKQVIPASAFYRVGTAPPPPPPVTLRDPENPAEVVVGLDYKYYEGTWTALPDFNALTPVKTGTIAVPDLSVRNRNDYFGLRFTGYVNVPTDGQYTFYTNSDDGSKLFIGTTEVVSHDGTHAQTEKSGTIGLKAGKHAITVVYFDNSGGEGLSVSYGGPGVNKQVIPASAFYRMGTAPPPPPPIVLRDPENPAEVVVGLDYGYYEGTWTALPNFTSLTPVKTGTTGVPDLSVRNRNDYFGLRFTGYVNVPTDGQYTFYTSSDDGSKLFIGTTEVVSHDGTHAQTEKSGTIGLKAGKHAITVVYFDNSGGEGLSVSYSGPGVNKQVIPAGAFYRVGTAPPPPPPVTLRDPENPAEAVVGLDYGYYEGTWTSLPNFTALIPVKTGTTGVPNLTVRNRNDYFGLRFTGYVEVPADGTYTFYTSSDDGSKLFIGTTEVVSHDGTHAQTEKSGTIGLKAGKHAITVVYFDNSGGEGLSVSYSGPNVSKQVIPASAFYRIPSTNTAGSGTGLRAEYFNNISLAAPIALTRTDAVINFDWGNGSPAPGIIGNDNYSARWTGQVEAPVTGNYVFSTVSDDGVRLWVNGVQVINNWTTHGPTTDNSPTIALTAGQKYDIRMEYFESSQGAVARLRWAYPGQGQQPIPQGWLYPAAGSGRVGAPGVVAESGSATDAGLVVYPVPAHDAVSIRYPADADGRVTVQLLNALGQSVLGIEEPVMKGENRIRLDVRPYPRGLYILTLTQGSRRLTHKVLLTE